MKHKLGEFPITQREPITDPIPHQAEGPVQTVDVAPAGKQGVNFFPTGSFKSVHDCLYEAITELDIAGLQEDKMKVRAK